MSLNSALKSIMHHISPTKKSQLVPLKEARGRINANPFYAKYSIPPYDISLRDGYGVKFSQLKKLPLCVENLTKVSTGTNLKGEYACIVEMENVVSNTIKPEVFKNSLRQDFIKPKGEDIKKGELLLKKRSFISAFDVANLASQGVSEIEVLKKIDIAYVCIGDELIDVKSGYKKGFIYNSNGYALGARGEGIGANTSCILIANDDENSIKQVLSSIKRSDIIVTIGGMSKNDSIDKIGDFLTPVFRGVALAPAGLSGFSFLNDTPLLHLPGLPMSAMLGFEILCVPLIYRFYGLELNQTQGISAIVSQDIIHKKNSQSVKPGFFDGKYFSPIKVQAGMMNILNRCNGYILPKKGIKKGDFSTFYPFVTWNTSS